MLDEITNNGRTATSSRILHRQLAAHCSEWYPDLDEDLVDDQVTPCLGMLRFGLYVLPDFMIL